MSRQVTHQGFALTLLLALLCLPAWATDVILMDTATARALGDPATHRQPTVVALWSLDCPHCKKYLQELGELARAHERVQVIAVAVEPWHREHGEVLDEVASEGPRYAYGDELPEALAYALDSGWRGELPRTLLFNGEGQGTARSGRLSMPKVLELLELAD